MLLVQHIWSVEAMLSLPLFLRIRIPESFIVGSTFVFIGISICMLSFTLLYLLQRLRLSANRQQAKKAFGEFLSEIILSESEEEINEVLSRESVQKITGKWLSKPFGRKVLIRELRTTHKSMSGTAAQNICWLYRHFNLHEDSLRKFDTKAWHKKTSAIQELAEMKQVQCFPEIYKETNNKNEFIRMEAQLAMVKLTGFEGLDFLYIAEYPVTQWQQLCLLQQLSEQQVFQWDRVPGWLQSKNDTVVEFALRMVENYKCYEVHDAVAHCLQHPSEIVRRQAIQTLREICQEHTAKLLESHFGSCGKEEQLYVLEVLRQVGSEEQLDFLISLLQHADDAVRYAVIKGIQQLSNEWYEIVERNMKPRPSSLNYVIAELKKEEAA